MLKLIKKLLKGSPCKIGCSHDWETVAYLDGDDIIRELKLSRPNWTIINREEEDRIRAQEDYNRRFNMWVKAGSNGSPPNYLGVSYHYRDYEITDTINKVKTTFEYLNFMTRNKVCMKCGECSNGLAYIVQCIEAKLDREHKRKLREERAQKLWKENCLYSDT